MKQHPPWRSPVYREDELYDTLGIWPLPRFLYHYTSIETLEKILSTRKLRFNRLDRVNDGDDGSTRDLPKSASTQFVSCWTSQTEESVPLWSMYTDFRGVRIGLPVDMFAGRPCPELFQEGGYLTRLQEMVTIERRPVDLGPEWREFENLLNQLDTGTTKADTTKADSTDGLSVSIVAIGTPFRQSISLLIGPNPVHYTDNADLLFPTLIMDSSIVNPKTGDILTRRAVVSPFDVGIYKHTRWSFEKEWRWRLNFFGLGRHVPLDPIGRATIDFDTSPVTTPFVDVSLSPDALREMEVLLGPKCSDDDMARVEAVLQQCGVDVGTRRSVLKIR